jgi:hypothetical protein
VTQIIYLDPPGYRRALDAFSEHFEACQECGDERGLCAKGMYLCLTAWSLMTWPQWAKKQRRGSGG